MGNQPPRIYTRTGDDGTTGMANGLRVNKDSLVVMAIGEIDELNAVIGVLRAENLSRPCDAALSSIQNDLFTIGAELAMSAHHQVIDEQYIRHLEQQIDQWNDSLEPLKGFILPAGNRSIALCHQARTVCRRAERSLIALRHESVVRGELVRYLNRLSDYLFIVARVLAHKENISEVYWDG